MMTTQTFRFNKNVPFTKPAFNKLGVAAFCHTSKYQSFVGETF